jgi:hypothetical protein
MALAALLCVSAPAGAASGRQVPPRFLGTVADGPVFDDATLSAAGTSLERELDLMVGAGIESVRMSFYWAPMQPYAS